MRSLARPALSTEALLFLRDKRTKLVARKRRLETRVATARALWLLQRNKTFVEIRGKLGRMCSGIQRCMYCEDSRGVAIDHHWPLSRYPLKAFEWENYLYVCTPCNTAKGNDFPLSAGGQPLLLDPTTGDPADDPALHLELTPHTGKFAPLTQRGTESSRAYDLDREDLARGRRNALTVFQALVAQYASLRIRGLDADANVLATGIQEERFSSILLHLLDMARGPGAQRLQPDFIAALNAHPEIRGWV